MISDHDTTSSAPLGELPAQESLAEDPASGSLTEAPSPQGAGQHEEPVLPADPGGVQPGQAPGDLLLTISESVHRLAEASERYHDRAKQRETVIDQLSAEVDRLRRGDRRGVLRPVLTEVCRLRNDLLRQAETLPPDFDADRARALLRSYAETVELVLEDNGILAFSPAAGEPFDPRMHRRIGDRPAADTVAVGRVASVRRAGYLDVESSGPIAPAEVVVFSTPAAGPAAHADPDLAQPNAWRTDRAAGEERQ